MADGLSSPGQPSMQIRVKRRNYQQSSNWQSAAGMGLLMGIVVISVFLLYLFLGPILKSVDWQQIFLGAPNPAAGSTPQGGPSSGTTTSPSAPTPAPSVAPQP